MSTENDVQQVTAAVVRGVSAAGRWAGRRVADAWRAVDPDLRWHIAQLPLVGLTLLGRGTASPSPLPDDGHRPVIFVHGLGGSPGNFLPMRTYFRLHGRRRTYAPAFAGGESLDQMAAQLARYLEEVVTVNGLPADTTVEVVAHSMGGLIARLAVDLAPRRVSTLVTLGTPHSGSHLARYGYTARSLDLRPDSEVLARLGRQLPWLGPPAGPRAVAFWSEADVIVLPAESARMDGARNVELPGSTHYGYLIHPAAWARVYEAMDLSSADASPAG